MILKIMYKIRVHAISAITTPWYLLTVMISCAVSGNVILFLSFIPEFKD